MVFRDVVFIGGHPQTNETAALGFLKDNVIEGMECLPLRVTCRQNTSLGNPVFPFYESGQGVGDLLTDPQIHTRDVVGFGRGNMGLRVRPC